MTYSKQHKEALEEFVVCLQENRFYDAHEVLEAIWFPVRFEDGDEVKLLKGFINASVCFELIKKQRGASAQKVWKNYLKYRPLLYTINSSYLNKYHEIARFIENIKYKNMI
jgi:hypothetical protein